MNPNSFGIKWRISKKGGKPGRFKNGCMEERGQPGQRVSGIGSIVAVPVPVAPFNRAGFPFATDSDFPTKKSGGSCPERAGPFVVWMKLKHITKNERNIMRTKYTSAGTTLLLATSLWLTAGESEGSKQSSPEFERLKTLVGTWQGKTDMGQGPIDMTVHYRLLAGGSVLEERVFAGTPNEMLTLYFDKGGRLALTHYCVMGNRPGMLLKSSDPGTLKFDFDETCGINPAKESHMHALTISFDNAETITTSCKAIIDGKEIPEHPTTLKRVKS